MSEHQALGETSAPWEKVIYGGLDREVKEHLSGQGYHVYSGKVRDVISRPQTAGPRPSILMVHSDRLTAFDKLITWVPYKGAILTSLTAFWLRKAETVVPTHLIDQIDERALHCHSTTPIRVEVVVRGYLAGSMMRAYAQGRRRFGSVTLPDHLVPFQKLPVPVITPTTKAAAFEHDMETTAEEIIATGLCDLKTWSLVEEYALKLFALGTQVLKEAAWILVDTKYEFGLNPQHKLLVIDEVHTPDSSRFWSEKTYAERLANGQAPDMLDKEIIRRWLMAQGYQGEGPVPPVPLSKNLELAQTYLRVVETLTGQPLAIKDPSYPKSTASWDALVRRLL